MSAERAALSTPVARPRRLRIAVDMDEVIADALAEQFPKKF